METFFVKNSEQKLNLILEALKQEFNPTKVFLFGSRASQQAHQDSDFDIVVVVKETHKSRIENLRLARALVRKVADVSADVFVYDQKEFDEYKNELSSIPETAMNTGHELDLG
jgi:predicted nucleotidyltransferase